MICINSILKRELSFRARKLRRRDILTRFIRLVNRVRREIVTSYFRQN